MSYEMQRLKQILGLDFAGGVVEAVEAQKKVLDDLKVALGLPLEASPEELEERISVIRAEHEEFLKQKPVPGFWQKLFGGK